MGIDSILFKILTSVNVYIFEVFFQANSAGKAWKVAIDTKFVSIFFYILGWHVISPAPLNIEDGMIE